MAKRAATERKPPENYDQYVGMTIPCRVCVVSDARYEEPIPKALTVERIDPSSQRGRGWATLQCGHGRVVWPRQYQGKRVLQVEMWE